MPRLAAPVLLLVPMLLTAAAGCGAQVADRAESVSERIREAARAAGAQVGVALRTLDGNTEVLVNPDEPFHAASTMKVPVLIALFQARDAGRLSLDDTVLVRDRFASIVDGSPFTLSAADDSETTLYGARGTRRPIRELCEAMIVVSSNLATNILIETVGIEQVRAAARALGATGMDVKRGVEDGLAFRAGLNNTTNARGLLALFTALATGTAASPASNAEMLAILERQRFNEGIPRGVPAGTRVAHKTGQITSIHHDAGIVYAPRPYVLVVLVRGLDDEQRSGALIATISRLAYEHTQK